MRIKSLFFLLFFLARYLSQPTIAAESVVQQATHNASASRRVFSSGEVVTFSQQPTQVGDRVAQRVGMELDLRTVIKQAGQVANDSSTAMRTRQQRQIEVMEVSGGQARRARVSYPLAKQMSPGNPDPTTEIAQVVEGKTYFISRVGEQLQVTDDTGAIPSKQEFEIVVGSMENFGKPNPLAEYLLGREIRVGDTLDVPLEIAAGMMGFDKMGSVEKFELQLEDLRDVDETPCAIFSATIFTTGSAESPLHIETTGSVAIEIGTARTIEATLEGPVTMTAIDNGVHYKTTGRLLMAVHSYYGSP
ncbi:hypothetical protein [Bythopirellula goksoeyrii]|uniref:Uncharacterized protein n=1 Tax=Bythopirellula goksoeyrii TaxID=1400387 RepID=A0A5B9Q743_9BACT|nr:hypothetical protein [Bythopirellula goksoeyrii]QEG33262.1 hypothetical protein Pr1d_05230 [Bythopirellula goksoeyrii]